MFSISVSFQFLLFYNSHDSLFLSLFTGVLMTRVINNPIKKELPIIWIDDVMSDILIIPALQAYYDSPNWEPVLTHEGLVYKWNDEAVVVPLKTVIYNRKWVLLWRTRSSRKIMGMLVEPKIPGNRLTNIFKEPSTMPTSKYLAAATILVFGNNVAWSYKPEDSGKALAIAFPEKAWYNIELADEVCSIYAKLNVTVNNVVGIPMALGIASKIIIEFKLKPQTAIVENGKEYVKPEVYEEFKKWVEKWRPGD